MISLYIFNFFIVYALAISNFADIQCGHRPRTPKIVGGLEADKAEFPWIVSITRRGNHFCGGTLISNKHVLTAAHCLCTGTGNSHFSATGLQATISQHDLTQQNSEAYHIGFKSIVVHPGYSCNRVKDDIAIMELEKEVQWTENASPACLPPEDHQKALFAINKLATVAGWGWTHEERKQGGSAKVLQKAKVHVIDADKCRSWYQSQGKKTKIQETQICAGHEQGGIDACWADSGGPLMVENNHQMMVIGVVSTGIGCARPKLPGIYTKVSEYVPWIRQIVAT